MAHETVEEANDLSANPENGVNGERAVGNGDETPSHNMVDEVAIAVVDDSREPSTAGSPRRTEKSSPTPSTRDSLRRASGKIANLRAAFEKQSGSDTLPTLDISKRRFARSPGRQGESDAGTEKLKEQYEVEIERLKSQHETELTKLREELHKEGNNQQVLESKCLALERQVEELGQGNTDIAWTTNLEQKINDLLKEKSQAQEEASHLQRQLYELKRGIAAGTRIDSQVTDSTFAEQWQNLYWETQGWVVKHFRNVRVDSPASEMCARLESIAEAKQLEMLRPIYQSWNPALKLAAFQTTVCSYFMEIFDESLLYGLPTQQDWRKHLKKAAETLPAVLPPISYNKWRAMTLDAVRQSERIEQAVESASKNLSEMICITLTALTEAEESQARVDSLIAIVKRAISLAHLFRVQRPQYEFHLPAPGSQFSSLSMEDTSAEGDTPGDRFVRCATFPHVKKIGDEVGDNVQISQLVIKAKVLCNG